MKYNETHKLVNDIEYKLCSDCNEWYPMNEDCFYKNKSSKDGFNPYCKECTRKRSLKYKHENIENARKRDKNYYDRLKNEDPNRLRQKYWNSRDKKLEYHQKWRKSDKGKEIMRKHSHYRNMHKIHNITDEEWEIIKEYFEWQCAYCGISEIESEVLYKQKLYKDHIYHDGNNDIDNCVPACKGCNTSKHDIDFKEWFNESNPRFEFERLNKIVKWATEDYKIIDQ